MRSRILATRGLHRSIGLWSADGAPPLNGETEVDTLLALPRDSRLGKYMNLKKIRVS
jgi:hypothetical protein